MMNQIDLRSKMEKKSLLGNPMIGVNALAPNKILVFNIHKALFPITTETLKKICNPVAEVIRIVVVSIPGLSEILGQRNQEPVQAMIEFSSIRDAINVRAALNGADIYDNCCTLNIEFAPENVSQLQVEWNDDVSWDIMLEANSSGPRMAGRTLLPSNDNMWSSLDRRDASSKLGRESDSRKRSYQIDEPLNSNHPSKHERFPTKNAAKINRIEGSVLLVRNLDESIYENAKATYLIFNLFSIYGNVLRVKMLTSKKGFAMVEMETIEGALVVMQNLKGVLLRGKDLQLRGSAQDCINGPSTNDVNKRSWYWDFTGSSYNRFTPSYKEVNKPLKANPPSKIVNFWNAVALQNDEETTKVLTEAFKNENVSPPLKIKVLKETKSARSHRALVSGMMEFKSEAQGIEAVVFCNNMRIKPESIADAEDKKGFALKLCFSNHLTDIPDHFIRRTATNDHANDQLKGKESM